MKKTILEFDSLAVAETVFPAPQERAEEVLQALSLPPYKAVLGLIGAADSIEPQLLPRLTQLFDRGIARAALEAEAILVDGGTQAGVMALMGAGVASRGAHSTLIGVAPAELVAYPGKPTGAPLEPNHSHFVLVEGTKWGSETKMLFGLIQALSVRKEALQPTRKPTPPPMTTRVPALIVLVGGGPTAIREVAQAVRLQLPILVVAGSGGLADTLAAAWSTPETPPEDPTLAEIMAEGTLRFYPLSGSVQGLERIIVHELGADHVLLQAWETFADYDANANRQQQRFNQLQQCIIFLGLVGTALAIGQQLYAPKEAATSNLVAAPELLRQQHIGWWLLHHTLLLIPITLTVLITATSRFKQGAKWLLLRAGAEAIKREIYRYRARAMYYQENAEQHLASRIEDITRRTMRTEVNTSSLVPYDKRQGFPPGIGSDGTADTGFGFLAPSQYLQIRLESQLAYFRRKAVRLERQLKILSWLTFVVGGVGTYMAAIGQQVWIALTTALAAAMGSYLGYRQTESTLTKYNQAATNLSNVRAWWNALPWEEQLKQQNIDLLVEHTEQVLQSEHDGWMQQMQNALAELHKNQPAANERKENEAPVQQQNQAAPPDLAPPRPAARPIAPPAEADQVSPPAVIIAAETADATHIQAHEETDELTAEAVLPTEDTTEVPPDQDYESAAPAATLAEPAYHRNGTA